MAEAWNRPGSARRFSVTGTVLGLVFTAGCAGNGSPSISPLVVVVQEQFITRVEPRSNMDSPAVWLGRDGEAWLISTGKSTNRLYVDDAATGAPVRTVGSRGTGAGQFRRPNGIAVVGDLVLIVERDNARVQVLRLPGFEYVTSFGEDVLRRPYGIAVLEQDDARFDIFITDDYRNWFRRTPPDGRLHERVRRFSVTTTQVRADDDETRVAAIDVAYFGSFGDTTGAGRLLKVESIAADPDAGTLLIADEASGDVKVYRTDGSFTGRVLWRDLIRHEPEGIALYACGSDAGYWVLADQDRRENRFLVFDRHSYTLVGAFTGEVVRNTDGIAIVQRPVGVMTAGALYAVHDDRAIGAIAWSEVAAALQLRSDCTGAVR
jgi:3-phytase